MSLVFAVLLVSAQAAAADAQPVAVPEAASPTEAPKKAKEKKICKTDDATSGTRMAKRVCLTEEEWAQRAQGMTQSARSGFSGKTEDH